MFPFVLFDLDGTLVNTIPDIAFAVNSALRITGAEEVSCEEMKLFVGRGLRNALQQALDYRAVRADSQEKDRLYEHLMETYRENPCRGSRPYDGIPELLCKLQSKGIRLGIFSSKEGELIRRITDTLLPEIRFDFIEGRYGRYKPKPDPEAVHAFLAQADISSLIYVGDSEVDKETADNAGCSSAIVTWGFRSREMLEKAGVTDLTDSVESLERRILE